MTVTPDLLAEVIQSAGIIVFSQIPAALPFDVGERVSRRSLNSSIHAALDKLLNDEPSRFVQLRSRVRLLAAQEIDVLWDSALHEGPMPVETVRHTLVEQWNAAPPNVTLDLYCARNTLNERDSPLPFREPDQISAQLMLVTKMLSLFPNETRRHPGLGGGNFCGLGLGPAFRHHSDPGWRTTDVYAPVLNPMVQQLNPTMFDGSLMKMELWATRENKRLQVVSPRSPDLPWPEFQPREDLTTEPPTNLAWTCWDEELSWGWG